MPSYDLRNATLDQFAQYIFENAESKWKDECDPAVDLNPSEFATLYTKLFSNPTFLLDRFTLKQLECGFWEIQSCNMPGNAGEIIFDGTVPFELRRLCIESMYSLYDNIFAIPLLPLICDMWWDGIAYGYCCGNYSRKNEDQRQLQDVMFSTLCRILALSSEPCQYGALHGLGHLLHPDTKQVIEEFLRSHKSFEGEAYARACIAGNIM